MRTRREGGFNRRDFLKGVGLGVFGAAALGRDLVAGSANGTAGLAGSPPAGGQAAPVPRCGRGLYAAVDETATVSLVKGNDRRAIVHQSLMAIEDDVFAAIGNKQVMIKPNVCVDKKPLAVTHVDAVRAVLDVLAPRLTSPILIAESGVFNTFDGYKNNGYLPLEKEYNCKLVDLNAGETRYHYVLNKDNKPQPVRLVAPFLDPGLFIISVARMKTHSEVVVTLALKNLIMAAPVQDYKKSDKGFMHQGPYTPNQILHFNLFHIAQKVYPDLAVIDGFESMEGDGPAWGTLFDSRVAIASLDALAADVVGTTVMGFDAQKILYLSAMTKAGMGQGDMAKIRVLGTPLAQCLYKFKPHRHVAEIYKL
ncbi:MAG: DUF362 domain-containing protein [Candidatus Aminicenantales bacterium]